MHHYYHVLRIMWRGFEKFVLMGAVWPALPRPHGPTLPAALDEPFLEVVLAALETGSTGTLLLPMSRRLIFRGGLTGDGP